MAINPATSVIATRDMAYKAVVPVDIQMAVADPSVVTADAQVVYIAGGSSSGLTNTVVGNVASGAADSGNPVKIGGRYNSTNPTLADGQRGDLQLGTRGSLITQTTLPNDTIPNTAVGTGTDAVTNVINALKSAAFPFVFNGSTWDRWKKGTTTSRIVSSAASTNATLAKNAAGNLHNICCINTNAAIRYLKLYNKASAPTVGTDTPVLTLPIPPNNGLLDLTLSETLFFSTGIAYALTTGSADSDTGAVGAGDIVGLNIIYS